MARDTELDPHGRRHQPTTEAVTTSEAPTESTASYTSHGQVPDVSSGQATGRRQHETASDMA